MIQITEEETRNSSMSHFNSDQRPKYIPKDGFGNNLSLSEESGSPDSCSAEEAFQGFGDYTEILQRAEEKKVTFECLMKTKQDHFKPFRAVVDGTDIFFYRLRYDDKAQASEAQDPEYKIMHSVLKAYLKEQPAELWREKDVALHPIKLVLPPNKSRVLFFQSTLTRQKAYNMLSEVITSEQMNITNFYDIFESIGRG